MKKPFIDFYTQIGFAPTGQLFGNQDKHRENRSNLYRKLGLHPKVLEGSTVLEIGPGSGENSIDLLARGIKSLKLVDGVPAVLESLQSRISGHTPVTYELYDAAMLPPKRETFGQDSRAIARAGVFEVDARLRQVLVPLICGA